MAEKKKVVTDTPQDNVEVLLNYARIVDKEVYLMCGEEGDFLVKLTDYLKEKALEYIRCEPTAEEIMNGVCSAMECGDCPMAVLNTVAIQAAEMRERLRQHESGPQWISMEEQLPSCGDRILAVTSRGDVSIYLCDHDLSIWPYGGSRPVAVTHWMPLPEPPKMEKQHAEV